MHSATEMDPAVKSHRAGANENAAVTSTLDWGCVNFMPRIVAATQTLTGRLRPRASERVTRPSVAIQGR